MFARTGSSILVALAAVSSIALTSAPAVGADEPPGKALFVKYCAACHGPDGTGNGVLAGLLKDQPKNLTLIAKNNGGTFPTQKVMRFIDGTTDVRAHGNPDMPVWGEVFKEQLVGSQAQQAEIRKIIIEITDYIASIQQK
jgi:mono/diheme cytochrome c family protein